jgi:gamma-glutamyltranspeptidase/glutathione hydrolase
LVSIGAGARALAEGATIEKTGAKSVGVPGSPHGYALLHDFARLNLADLVAAAVQATRIGVPWTRVARSYVVEGAPLLAKHSPTNPYAPGGRIPEIGELRQLPGLGALLLAYAERREAIFESEIGDRVVAAVQKGGGFLTCEDFAQRPGRFIEAERGEIGPGLALQVTPAPTHGPQLLDIAKRFLRGDGDLPSIVRSARNDAKARGREPADGGTSVVTAADDNGNAVVILHSNSFPQFASGIVLDDGLILNNRPGRGFDLSAPAGAANAPTAGKVPWTTLHAWCLSRPDGLLLGAGPGGVNQIPWNAQTVTELARNAGIVDAMSNPRWSLDAENVLAAEEGVDANIIADKNIEALSLRSAQQVIRLSETGLHEAAADPRTGATAIAVY